MIVIYWCKVYAALISYISACIIWYEYIFMEVTGVCAIILKSMSPFWQTLDMALLVQMSLQFLLEINGQIFYSYVIFL